MRGKRGESISASRFLSACGNLESGSISRINPCQAQASQTRPNSSQRRAFSENSA
jgi:hypothetical protein